MNNISFLHIGDVHLDSRINGLDETKRNMRQIETQLTLKKILNDNTDAKIVLFAGDLFDGELNDLTIIFLCKLFSEHNDKRFFITCGNHDYLSGKCLRRLLLRLPENVRVFSDFVSYYDVEDCNLRIYGCSFSAPHLYSSLLSGFKAESNSKVNIMLMHGDVGVSSEYNPIEVSDVINSGLDYLALGHRHTFSGIQSAGNTLYAYPGILEPRGFDECGECGYIKGIIADNKIKAEFIPCSYRKYEVLEIDISDVQCETDLIDKINSLVSENNLYRIILTGTRKNNLKINIDVLKKFTPTFYCELFDKTTVETSVLTYCGENSLRGKTADVLDRYVKENKISDEHTFRLVENILTELLCKGGNGDDN